MKTIEINGREIGGDAPVYIIAEAGSNHNGSMENARKLIDIAAEAGADAVKFQIFKAEKLYSKNTPGFESLATNDIYGLIKDIETPRDWISELAEYCNDKGITFMATPFDHEAVDILDSYSPAFKIASFEIVDLELIRYTASRGKPLIISTGMANPEEINDAIEAARSVGNENIALLHCNSLYPTPAENVNLKAIRTMLETFDNPIGFSDHTTGIHVPLAAVAMGASVIEKHFTMDKSLPGPDHSFALDPAELREMVRIIRETETAFGDGVKGVSEMEAKENYMKGRRSIHALGKIPEGGVITKEMLIIKRPAYGIKPKEIERLVGCRAKRTIEEDEWITWDMVIEND